MKEKINKNPLNAPGKYYVDYDTCIDHECCVDAAPNNFKMDENWSAYVFKQPVSAQEEKQYREAFDACPVAAIHDDGDTR